MKISINKAKLIASQYKTYFKSSFLYLFSALFTAAIGIAINPFMAKNLSPEDYAILGYFSSFNFFSLGLYSIFKDFILIFPIQFHKQL